MGARGWRGAYLSLFSNLVLALFFPHSQEDLGNTVCVLEVRGAPGPPFILKEQTWGPTAERALMFEQSLLREPVFKPLLRAGGSSPLATAD